MQVGQTETSASGSVDPEATQADPPAVIALLFLPSRPIGHVTPDAATASPGPPERSAHRPRPSRSRGNDAVATPTPRDHVANRAASTVEPHGHPH